MKGASCLVAVASIALLFLLFFWTHAAALPSQIGVFRPSSGQWYFDYSGNRVWDRCGPDGCLWQFGGPTDLPITGDWSGNGVPKIGVFRPADGRWYLDLNGNSFWDGCGTDGCFGPFGAPEDRPVVGDWDGTDALRFGVFRPTTGQWFFDLNGNGAWDGCGTDGCSGPFGAPEDLPVAGDLNGDTVDEFGVFRPSTGMWYFDLDHSGSWSGCGQDGCLGPFGAPGDQPGMTDINGDEQLEFGVFRPSTGQWYFDLDHNGIWSGCGVDGCYGPFGAPGDLPAVGAWDRSAGPGDPLNYFPVTQGSSWTYQGTYSDSDGFNFNYQNTATVSGTRLIDGVTTTVVSISNPGGDGPFEEYLLKDGRGITNWGNNDPADTITPLVAVYQEIIFPLWAGASFKKFELAGVDLGDDLDGDGINERVNMSSQVTVAGFESVVVTAGSFSNCAKVVNTLSISGSVSGLPSLTFNGTTTATTWYAPGTGPVKIETYMLVTTSNGGSFSYFDAESLTSANIIPSQGGVGNPVQIGTGYIPQLAVAANGDAVCVWTDQYPPLWGTYSIWASSYIHGVGWGVPIPLENHSESASSPKVAIDSIGRATAIWIEGNNLWANRFVPGVGWGTPIMIDANPAPDSPLEITADPIGNVTLLWINIDSYDYHKTLWANRYELATGWGGRVMIDQAVRLESPRIASDASGNAIAVYYKQVVGESLNTLACSYLSGVGWGTAELIEGNEGWPNIDELAISINQAGTAVAAWAQWDGLYMSIWTNRFVPGVGWDMAVKIEDNPNNAFGAKVAVAPDGNTNVLWLHSDGTNESIWVNQYVPGLGWGTPLQTQNSPNGGTKRIDLSPDGVAKAVWVANDAGISSVQSSTYIPGSDWSIPQSLKSNINYYTGVAPVLSLDEAGNAIVVWSESILTGSAIWTNRF